MRPYTPWILWLVLVAYVFGWPWLPEHDRQGVVLCVLVAIYLAATCTKDH